jgi:hypothetical protein
MSPRTKAFLTLVFSTPILTEIVSGNTPAHALLDPRVALFLLMAYSLPLLVLRELALRWGLSTPGVFVLGLAYGIWNEGLLARTLLRYQHVPIARFDHYVCAAGFNFSWAALIVPWHALLAILFPLALVAGLFPSEAQATWLGKRVFAALAAVLIALILFLSIVRKPHPQMLACLFAMAALVFVSWLFRGRQALSSRRKIRAVFPFAVGAVGYPAFISVAILLAGRRAPALAYFSYVVAGLTTLGVLCRRFHLLRPPAAARLAVGAYFAASLFNLLGGITRHSLETILTGGFLAAVFLLAAFIGLREGSLPASP